MNDFPVPPQPITVDFNGLYFFVVFEELYYFVNCCYHNCLSLFGKIFKGVFGSIFLFRYFNFSFPFVNIFIIIILFCDCLQVLVSFYCYLTMFQVIIDRQVFVLANVNCYIIDAFIIQFVVSKMTVMYPSCQSIKCFFVKILFINIRMVDTFLNKYFNLFLSCIFHSGQILERD
jgi:hypothetical protein